MWEELASSCRSDRCFRLAIELARDQGARWWELRATTSAARLALARGTRASVRRAEREALGALVATFSEGADTRDLQDARQVLAERVAPRCGTAATTPRDYRSASGRPTA